MEIVLPKAVRLDQLHQELAALNLEGFTGLSTKDEGGVVTITVHTHPSVGRTPAEEQAVRDMIAAHVPQPTAPEQTRVQLAVLSAKGQAQWTVDDLRGAVAGLLLLIGIQ